MLIISAVPAFSKPRSNRLTRKQVLQLADGVARLGFPIDFSGNGSLRLQYQIVPMVDLDQGGKQIGEELEVMVHSKRLQIGEYLRFQMDRSHACVVLNLEFTADVLRYKSGALKGQTQIEDPTIGMYVVYQLADDLMEDMFPSPLYIVPAKQIRETCAQVTTTDRRYFTANEPKRLMEKHAPATKRLTREELGQLAEAFFRLPENDELNAISFRYVIGYSAVAEGEALQIILEPPGRREQPGFEDIKFKPGACMEFSEMNAGVIVYDKNRRPEVESELEGGLVVENAYYDAMRNIRSTPLLTFHRNELQKSCGKMELVKDDWFNSWRQDLHTTRQEKAKEKPKKLPRDFYR